MSFFEHHFTQEIYSILEDCFPSYSPKEIITHSLLLQYLNLKTRSANKNSKSRSSFANHYAIYVLLEDYIKGSFEESGLYKNYEGAKFSDLLTRQRELPFGKKLQNHALNHRLNEEFKKFFPASNFLPIIRDSLSNKYWINENLLKITINNQEINIADCILKVINKYISFKQEAFDVFMKECELLLDIENQDPNTIIRFIKNLLSPKTDARIFEIVSYAILKQHYSQKLLYWGWSLDSLNQEFLILYKTGRTNANDGGIDFVMKPLGRFFQVTEIIDSGKYFLDIDKVQRYPITFVIKTDDSVELILSKIKKQAQEKYVVEKIVERYISCIEEIINVPILLSYFNKIIEQGKINIFIQEIILQSRLEFNIEEEE